MSMRPFETRLWPIQRSHRSFLEPSMEVGNWRDFGYQQSYVEGAMRDMERQMNEMFRSFNQLLPITAPPSTSTALMSPIPAMPKMEQLQMENPYVMDKDGNRKLQLQFDVRQFKPEEIQVKTQDRQLCVHAKHEEKSDGHQVYREYQRYYMLPENLEPERLSSVLSPEGVLSIEAPVPAIDAPKKESVPIAIKHN